MANPNITGLRFMRLRDVRGYMGHAAFMRLSTPSGICVETRLALNSGLAQGRIVSISRGLPPPKKR